MFTIHMGVAAVGRVAVGFRVRVLAVCPLALACMAQSQDTPSPPRPDPFSNSQRIQYFIQRTFSWQKMTMLGAESAFDHATGGAAKWGGGPFGIASRYGD